MLQMKMWGRVDSIVAVGLKPLETQEHLTMKIESISRSINWCMKYNIIL